MNLPGITIELAVYACFEDVLLFVPVLCRPPREAEAAFGPLSQTGAVLVSDLDGAWIPILTQIERDLFATVPRREGELLIRAATGAATPSELSETAAARS